ncbi:Zn-dependent oxidoreductase [Halomonas huangheensis]|uniref:Enoyl reductase (ER) domain-containing protein n=1 Tax=Halomonas huangheensis TaxID=1178482 RepID=W1N973_9GAMM|nr:Zn-dependent oxidoreductase [Halomonas huangheensis]ALM53556.1 alcohol dehydrogenase [Halomonas huangheensis]ERL51751.1 hypothetical protein BJB45_11340 [Halomonas huangheensis]
MQAFQVKAPHDYDVSEQPAPQLEAGEVLVGVAYAGICGSDMHIIHGDNAFVRFPRITGHEFAGVIRAVGEGVDAGRVGERVCIDPVVSCGECYPCRIGRPNVCSAMQVIGVHRHGGFAEQVNVPAANAYPIPDSLELDAAALVEPYSIAANVLSHMEPLPGDRLLVIGAGVIGLTIVQMAQAMGIEEIIVTDILAERLDTALELGARHVIHGAEQDLEQTVQQLTAGEGVPLIADAACIPAMLPTMLRIACPAGRIGLLGFSPAPSDLIQLEVIKKELTLIGSRLNNRKFPEVLAHIDAGRLDPRALISHRVALRDMPGAIHMLDTTPEKARKVLVDIAS